jgi:hypothetical protein
LFLSKTLAFLLREILIVTQPYIFLSYFSMNNYTSIYKKYMSIILKQIYYKIKSNLSQISCKINFFRKSAHKKSGHLRAPPRAGGNNFPQILFCFAPSAAPSVPSARGISIVIAIFIG